MKYRTRFANHPVRPYSTSHTATPTPKGTAMALAMATISIVPRMAERIPPGLPRKRPVGSVVKKSTLKAPRPFFSR